MLKTVLSDHHTTNSIRMAVKLHNGTLQKFTFAADEDEDDMDVDAEADVDDNVDDEELDVEVAWAWFISSGPIPAKHISEAFYLQNTIYYQTRYFSTCSLQRGFPQSL